MGEVPRAQQKVGSTTEVEKKLETSSVKEVDHKSSWVGQSPLCTLDRPKQLMDEIILEDLISMEWIIHHTCGQTGVALYGPLTLGIPLIIPCKEAQYIKPFPLESLYCSCLYFANLATHDTTWLDGLQPTQTQPMLLSPALATPQLSSPPQSLPVGWETRIDASGRVFYIDHNTRQVLSGGFADYSRTITYTPSLFCTIPSSDQTSLAGNPNMASPQLWNVLTVIRCKRKNLFCWSHQKTSAYECSVLP
jgi:hypothetical protein